MDNTVLEATTPTSPTTFEGHNNRWSSLLGSVYIMLTCGTMYLFSAFSGDLAEELSFNTSELNNISTCGMLGAWASLFGGLFCDRFGPPHTAHGSGLMITLGWVIMGLCCQKLFPPSSSLFAFGMLLVGQGSGWGYIASSKAAISNFHIEERGMLIGSLVCFFALSAGVYAQTYKAIFRPHFSLAFYFYFMAITVAVTQTLGSYQLKKKYLALATMSPMETKRLKELRYLSFVLIGWVLCMSLTELYWKSDTAAALMWVVLAAIVGTFAALPLFWKKKRPLTRGMPGDETQVADDVVMEDRPAANTDDNPPQDEGRPAAMSNVEEGKTVGAGVEESPVSQPVADVGDEESPRSPYSFHVDNYPQTPHGGPPITFLQTLKKMDFWILLCIYTTALGYSITLINNAATLLAAAMDIDTKTCGSSTTNPCTASKAQIKDVKNHTEATVALFAVFNALGRMFFGPLADRYKSKHPRVVWLAVATAGIGLSSAIIILLFFHFYAILVGYVIAAFGMGGVFAITPLATSELFGVRNFGSNWGTIGIAPGLAVVLCSTLLAGSLTDSYTDINAVEDPQTERLPWFLMNDRRYCLGWSCYSLTLALTGLLLVLSAMLAMWLTRRIREGKCRMEK